MLAGFTPVEALAAATSVPAARFGLSDRGKVSAGRRADLVLVQGNPCVDIAATRSIISVWRAGLQVDRDSYADDVSAQHEKLAQLRKSPPPPGSEHGKISDFEDGRVSALFGAGWQTSTDAMIGGSSTSTISLIKNGRGDALAISGMVMGGDAVARWAGAVFFPGSTPMEPANLSTFKRLTFAARSHGGSTMTVMLFALQLGTTPAVKQVVMSKRWKTYSISLSDFGAHQWYDVTGLFFGVTTPGAFSIELDDVHLE